MPSPFPGMDPYLEEPLLWPEVHDSMIVYIRDLLQPLLRPRFIATLEARVYIAGAAPRPDVFADVAVRRNPAAAAPTGTSSAVLEADAPVRIRERIGEVRETYVTILDRASDGRVVTVIEVISPTNKYAGPGRDSYLAKQRDTRDSATHLVEIDLLRNGPSVVAAAADTLAALKTFDYLVCVNRAAAVRDLFEFYPWRLRGRLPRVGIPLADGVPDVVLDLPTLLNRVYDAGVFADRLRYDQPCRPQLSASDQEWANAVVATAS